MTRKYPFWLKVLKKIHSRFGHRILPKWCVFAFDVVLVFILVFAAFLIRINFHIDHLPLDKVFKMGLFVSAIYGLFFQYFQTHSGIIRHTGLNDILKLAKASGIASLFLIIMALVATWVGNRPDFLPPVSVLLIHLFLTMTLLWKTRFLVRAVFQHVIRTYSKKQQGVLIFGAGVSGRFTRSALQADMQVNYKILAFLDDNPSIEGKFIEGIPIYTPERFFLNGKTKTFQDAQQNGPNLLVIAVQQLSQQRRREVMEMALAHAFSVKVVPPVCNWINGSLNTNQLQLVRIEELLERPMIHMNSNTVSQSIQGKVVMITGAFGSIGSELARQVLVHSPQKLILLDQAESGLFDLQFAFQNDPVLKSYSHLLQTVVGSVCDPIFLQHTLGEYKPELIYHAAAYKHVPLMEENPYMAVMNNVFGTKTLVDAALQNGCKKFVFVSTDKAVNPCNVMGASKRIAEMYVQSHNSEETHFITTRFGNVLGSNGSVLHIFQKQLDAGGPLTVTHKDVYRYFMLISEACSLVMEAGVMGNGGEIFLFDMGTPVKIYDLARHIIQLNGLTPHKDINIEFTGLRPGEKLFEELLYDKEYSIPTHHPKIMIAQANTVCSDWLGTQLDDLQQIAATGNNMDIVGKMRDIVEEYVPQNSIFATADNNGNGSITGKLSEPEHSEEPIASQIP